MTGTNFNGRRSAGKALSVLAFLLTGLVAPSPLANAEKCVQVGGH